jgi:hypothetical protein
MNTRFPWLSEKTHLVYLTLFLVMIGSGLGLFPAARAGSGTGMVVCLFLVIAANLVAILL